MVHPLWNLFSEIRYQVHIRGDEWEMYNLFQWCKGQVEDNAAKVPGKTVMASVCGILSMPVPQPALLVIANTLHEIAIIMQVHPSAQLSQCATSVISPFWLWNLLQSFLVSQHPCAISFRAHTNSISAVTVIASNSSLLLNSKPLTATLPGPSWHTVLPLIPLSFTSTNTHRL